MLLDQSWCCFWSKSVITSPSSDFSDLEWFRKASPKRKFFDITIVWLNPTERFSSSKKVTKQTDLIDRFLTLSAKVTLSTVFLVLKTTLFLCKYVGVLFHESKVAKNFVNLMELLRRELANQRIGELGEFNPKTSIPCNSSSLTYYSPTPIYYSWFLFPNFTLPLSP